MSEETPQRDRGRWVRAAALVLCALFVIQATVSLAVYFHMHTKELDGAILVYGDRVVAPGSTSTIRVGLTDARSPRWQVYTRIDVSHADGEAVVELASDRRAPALATFVAPAEAGTFALQVRVASPIIEERTFEVNIEVAEPEDVMQRVATYTRAPSARAPDRSSANDQPRVTWIRHTDTCPYAFHVVPAGGVAPRDIEVPLWIRAVDGAGEPLRGEVFTIEAPEGSRVSPTRVTTDRVGTTRTMVRVAWPEPWVLRFTCEGASVERRFTITPSWDGIALWPESPSVVEGAWLSLELFHQRRSGESHADLLCDDRVVRSQSAGIRPGPQRLEILTSRWSGSARVRLCVVQSRIYLQSSDPPRAVHYVLMRPDGMSERQAIEALFAGAQRYAPDAWSTFVDEGTREALVHADTDALRGLGMWLLSALPQPFTPMQVLLDDRPHALAAFDERRALVQGRLRMVLFLDAFAVVTVVLGILVPGWIAQRRRWAVEVASLDDPTEEEPPPLSLVSSRYEGLGVMAAGIALLIGFFVALGALMIHLQ